MREMKDSGIQWIGDMPSHWDCIRGKYFLKYLQKPVRDDDGVITCFRDGEVTLRSNRREEGFTMADKEIGYQGIDIGDLVVHGMDGFAGAIGISDSRGKASPVLNVLDTDQNKRYIMYYLRSMAYSNVFLALATGIRVRSCDLRWNKLSELFYSMPPIEEQECIADYLDSKCSEIDTLSEEIQFEIDTLEEYKKSTIYDAITHGIQSINLVHSESDVWKEIPETWKLVDIKYLFEIVKRIAGKEGFDILAVTQRGLKIKDITSGDGQLADNYSNYQFVYPADYVMNHMDLLTGWVDCSTMFGVTSPDYRVFRLRDKEKHDLDYYKYVMQCCYMNRIFYSLGQGVSNLGRWRLQTSVFNNFKVPVPPIEEQKAIATYLNSKIGEINSIIDTKKEQLTTLIDYKKSLIYEYVTGKKEVPKEDSSTVVALEPRMMLLGTIIDKLGNNQKGRIQLQKILYLADMHLGLNRNVQYYRYDHGPYDIHLNDYIDNMVKNGWYQHRNQGGALLVAGKNHADFLHNAKNMFGDKETEIENLLNLLQSMNVLKRTRMERIATLYAAWNDFLLEGITPTDDQIIQEVMTNWTENKGNTKYETWQDSLNKMKSNGLIPKGTGLHTLPKPQKEVADNE